MLRPKSPIWSTAKVWYWADSAWIFGTHISDGVAAPGSRTSGGALVGPLMRTNVGPYDVGTVRSCEAIGHSLAARESRYAKQESLAASDRYGE
jgi:hypothetical protein